METFFFVFLALIAPPQIFGSSCANSLEHTHTHLRLDLGQQSGGLVHLEFPVFPFDNRVQRVDDDGVADFASVVLHFGGTRRLRTNAGRRCGRNGNGNSCEKKKTKPKKNATTSVRLRTRRGNAIVTQKKKTN